MERIAVSFSRATWRSVHAVGRQTIRFSRVMCGAEASGERDTRTAIACTCWMSKGILRSKGNGGQAGLPGHQIVVASHVSLRSNTTKTKKTKNKTSLKIMRTSM